MVFQHFYVVIWFLDLTLFCLFNSYGKFCIMQIFTWSSTKVHLWHIRAKRTTSGSESGLLVVLRVNTKHCEAVFQFLALKVCNCLPEDERQAEYRVFGHTYGSWFYFSLLLVNFIYLFNDTVSNLLLLFYQCYCFYLYWNCCPVWNVPYK